MKIKVSKNIIGYLKFDPTLSVSHILFPILYNFNLTCNGNVEDNTSTINGSSEVVVVTPEATTSAALATVSATLVVIVPVVSTVPMNYEEKPNKFNSTYFKRCQ